MKELTKAEELLLLAILRLKKNAYGVVIRNDIHRTTGKSIAYGTLYFLLDQLTHKSHVEKFKGEPTPERGGRSKTYYRLTTEGIEALEESFELNKKAWKGFAEITWKKGLGK